MMDNGLYTTIAPEQEYPTISSPDEEMEQYYNNVIEPSEIIVDEPMHRIRDNVANTFCRDSGIQCNALTRDGYWGLEVPKKDTDFICCVLNMAGINYNIHDGRIRNIYGHWTKKSFNFIQISDKDFRVLSQKLEHEITVIGDDSQ